MMFWYGGGWAWWQAGVMWIAMIAFWAFLIWAVYALVTGFTRGRGGPDRGGQETGGQETGGQETGGQRHGGARRILDERLARGEIDPEEYRRLREVLDEGSGHSPAGTRG